MFRSKGMCYTEERETEPNEAGLQFYDDLFDKMHKYGMVQDDARIAYLRAHIEQMKKAVDEDGVDLIGYCPRAPSTSSPPAPARWRSGTASSTSIRTTRAREHTRAPARNHSIGIRKSSLLTARIFPEKRRTPRPVEASLGVRLFMTVAGNLP